MSSDVLFVLGIELSRDHLPTCPAFMLGKDDRVYRESISFSRAAAENPLVWHAKHGPSTPKHRVISNASLLAAERVIRPDRLLRKATGLMGAPGQHTLFALRSTDGPVWVPALLLLATVFARNARLSELLYHFGGIDAVVRPGARSRDGSVDLHVGGAAPLPLMGNDELRILAWLALDKRARGSWDSVYQNAWGQGRLDWSPPDIALSAWAWGIEVAGGLLATQLRGVRLCIDHRIERVIAIQGEGRRVVTGRGDGESTFSFGAPAGAIRRPDGLPIVF